MVQLEVENDLARGAESFTSERKVRLVLGGQEGTDHDVNTGAPQGSPVSPILFTHLPVGPVPTCGRQCFVDDVAWLARRCP